MRWVKILAVVLILAVAGGLAVNPILENLKLGLDLQGGVHVVLLADDPRDGEVSKKDMEQLTAVMGGNVLTSWVWVRQLFSLKEETGLLLSCQVYKIRNKR